MVGCLCISCDGFWPDDDGNYRVGICGTCHDDIAAAYHLCCMKANKDEKDALLLVGYIYGSLHGTPDCQALMARSYDDGNPFRISHMEGKYHFMLPPTHGGNYTFTANLKKCRTFIKVVLDDGARTVYGPPRPHYQNHMQGKDPASGQWWLGNRFLNVQNTPAPFAEQSEERRIDPLQHGRVVTWNEFVRGRDAHRLTLTLLQLHEHWLNLPRPCDDGAEQRTERTDRTQLVPR